MERTMKHKYLVTGATGCIGSWVTRNLVKDGETVYALVRDPQKLQSLRLIMTQEEIDGIQVVKGDILDGALIRETVIREGITKIIHLAAMQMPFCAADPVRGARVNVEGTVNVFEAAKAAGLPSIVYSSSTAVYGKNFEYENGVFNHMSPFLPHSHYGVYKIANEGSAKVYFENDGISSIGIRPYVVYGPMRDQGMTSTPTTAIKMAVQGKEYKISFGGWCDFQYADDTARAFIAAANADFEGAEVFNLGGERVSVAQIIEAIGHVCPGAAITYDDIPLPFPQFENGGELEKVIGTLAITPLAEGIAQSAEIFRNAQGM